MPPASSHGRSGGAEVPVYRRRPLEPVSGRGARLQCADGRQLLDFYGGHAAALLGQGHPALLSALQEQARDLFFQTNLVELGVRREAARALAAFAPEGLDRVFLVSSGAEANENALRLALRATGRGRVVALEGGFHGRTAGAGACTFRSRETWYAFPRPPFEVAFVPPDDPGILEAAVTGETAALILEPIQGLAGARPLSPGYLQQAREITRRRGAWLIADEVQSGMGRTGRPFAVQAAGIRPDVLTTAKGLAGGFPAGAVLLPEAVAHRLPAGSLGTTFGGGPLACALIRAVVETVSAPGFLERVLRLGEQVQATCRVGPVEAVQGRGLLLGLRTRPPAARVLEALLERGILAGGATDPHVVRLTPPLVIDEADVATLAGALAELET